MGITLQLRNATKGVNMGREKELWPNDAACHSQRQPSPFQGACWAAGVMDHQGVPQALGSRQTELCHGLVMVSIKVSHSLTTHPLLLVKHSVRLSGTT